MASGLGILGDNVDVDTVHLEIARIVNRRDRRGGGNLAEHHPATADEGKAKQRKQRARDAETDHGARPFGEAGVEIQARCG